MNSFPIIKNLYWCLLLVLHSAAICSSDHRIGQYELIETIVNPCNSYTLINSVDFHPKENIFCVTFTQCNRIDIYKINEQENVILLQTISNPLARLNAPQHAVFSHDGKYIVAMNWVKQELSLYQLENEEYSLTPTSIIRSLKVLKNHKPHGITVSPCGRFLVIAFGASNLYPRAIALYDIGHHFVNLTLVKILQENELPSGIPKGVTFTKDGKCLVVSFADPDSLAIYDIAKNKMKVSLKLKQIVTGNATDISRPEDIKISSDGNFCAISNSDKKSVSFFPFDSIENRILNNKPSLILKDEKANFAFPHGLAFSPDGSYFVVTQFGEIEALDNGDVKWSSQAPPDKAKIHIFKIKRP